MIVWNGRMMHRTRRHSQAFVRRPPQVFSVSRKLPPNLRVGLQVDSGPRLSPPGPAAAATNAPQWRQAIMRTRNPGKTPNRTPFDALEVCQISPFTASSAERLPPLNCHCRDLTPPDQNVDCRDLTPHARSFSDLGIDAQLVDAAD